MKIIVLISLARHPLSGKPFCSPNDLRALAIGQSIEQEIGKAAKSSANEKDVQLIALHAGDPMAETLMEYTGYGISTLNVIKTKKDDPCPHLARYLLQEKPDLVIAGMQALGGLESGMVPYLLADKINYPIISGVFSCSLEDDKIQCSQYLPKGRRRAFVASLPLIITIHPRATSKPQFTWAQRQQGRIRKISKIPKNSQATAITNFPSLIKNWDYAAADKKRNRLSIGSNRSGFERMQRAISIGGGGGNVIKEGNTAEKAAKIYSIIHEKEVYPVIK